MMNSDLRQDEPQMPWGICLLRDDTSNAAPDSISVDIVAVHGLGANPDHAWISRENLSAGTASEINWLTDLLPRTLQEYLPSIHARIFCYNYQSAWLGKSLSKNRLETIAGGLLDAIHYVRLQDQHLSRRPIIFIDHSFGGLVIEQAIVKAQFKGSPYTDLADHISGIILLGTPHQGSKSQRWGAILAQLAQMVEYGETVLMDEVDEKSMKIFDLVCDFTRIMIQTDLARTLAVVCFYETRPTNYVRRLGSVGRFLDESTSTMVVEETSAVLAGLYNVFLDSDHVKLNKFTSAQDGNYMKVSSNLARVAAQAPGLIAARRRGASQTVEKYYVVPRERVSNFIGREEQFRQILSHFPAREESIPRVLVPHAMGGQGKSQIALEYCRHMRQIYRGIFWINASSEPLTTQSCETIMTRLVSAVWFPTRSDAEALIRLVHNTLEQWNERWLLVFDNYDEPQNFNLQRFIPIGGYGDVLVTSRRRGLGRLGTLLEIPPLPTLEGVSLLLRGHDEHIIQPHLDVAFAIVTRLGCLPLAIDQAATYIQYKQIPADGLENFLSTYDKERKKILTYTPPTFWEYGTVQIHGEAVRNQAISVFTTWEMSFQQLQSDGQSRKDDMAHLLTLSAFLGPVEVEEQFFCWYWRELSPGTDWMRIFTVMDDYESTGDDLLSEVEVDDHNPTSKKGVRWQSENFWRVISRLNELSLLQSVQKATGAAGASFLLHPLIRDWLQLCEAIAARQHYTEEATDLVATCIQYIEAKTTTAEQRAHLQAHADACIANDERFVPAQHQLSHDIGNNEKANNFWWFYEEQGRYNTSERLIKLILETRKRVLGQKHPDTLTCIGNLASTFRNQGRWKEVEELEMQVMERMKRVFGQEHPHTLTSMGNLASTFQNQGRWKEAEELGLQVMETMKRVLGQEHPRTLTSMGNLASTFQNQGRWKEAEELEVQVMETMKKVLGQEHPRTLTSMGNLALIFGNQGRWKEAEELEVQVVETRKRVVGQEHHHTLTSMGGPSINFSESRTMERG